MTMQLILQPNRWTCNPAAFAMCMGIPYHQVIETLGHDGSEVIDPSEKNDVHRTVGFDANEMVLAAYKLGFAAIELPVHVRSPISGKAWNERWHSRPWEHFPTDQRFVMVLRVPCERPQYHCVAWQRDQDFYLDPEKGKLDLPIADPISSVIAITRINR